MRNKEVLEIYDCDGTVWDHKKYQGNKYDWAPQLKHGYNFYPQLLERAGCPVSAEREYFSYMTHRMLDSHVKKEIDLNRTNSHSKVVCTSASNHQNGIPHQIEKIERLGLGDINRIVLPMGLSKSKSIISYVKERFNFGDVGKIIMFEDNPQRINIGEIEEALQLPLEMVRVTLNGQAKFEDYKV